jgi:hypothetical protein
MHMHVCMIETFFVCMHMCVLDKKEQKDMHMLDKKEQKDMHMFSVCTCVHLITNFF